MKRALAPAVLTVAALALVSTASPAPSGTAHVVSIYAPRGVSNDCARVLPLRRVVRGPALLRGTMQALLAGPTKAERVRGYGGWFSAKTAGHLAPARISSGPLGCVAARNWSSFRLPRDASARVTNIRS